MKAKDLFFYIVVYFALCVSAASFAFVKGAEATVAELKAENAVIAEERDELRAELWRLDDLMERGNRDGQMARLPMPDAEYIKPVDTSTPIEAVAVSAIYQQEANPWHTIDSARITAYCPCEKCCGKWANGITASGVYAVEGRTVAVDPSVIPLGSEVEIGGRIYIAEDTGATGEAIDLYMQSHSAALQWGVHTMTVRWRNAA